MWTTGLSLVLTKSHLWKKPSSTPSWSTLKPETHAHSHTSPRCGRTARDPRTFGPLRDMVDAAGTIMLTGRLSALHAINHGSLQSSSTVIYICNLPAIQVDKTMTRKSLTPQEIAPAPIIKAKTWDVGWCLTTSIHQALSAVHWLLVVSTLVVITIEQQTYS